MSKRQCIVTGFGIAVLAAGGIQAQDLFKPMTESVQAPGLDSIGQGARRPLTVGVGASRQESEKAEPKEKGPTVITAHASTFDNRIHQAIFIKNVVVVDPEFNVNCDKLTAYFRSEKTGEAAKAGVPAKPAVPTKPAEASGKSTGPKPGGGGGGLEKAIAESTGTNRVRIVQDKVEANGVVTHNIGDGKTAVYDASTGDITLTGMPTVQQGFNMCVALAESTVIILNRDGHMRVDGDHKTIIKDANAESTPR